MKKMKKKYSKSKSSPKTRKPPDNTVTSLHKCLTHFSFTSANHCNLPKVKTEPLSGCYELNCVPPQIRMLKS